MHGRTIVKLTPRTVPATPDTIAKRENTAQRLDTLDQIDASAGSINEHEVRWYAELGGTEVPVLDFGVQKLDDGTAAVSLVLVADELTVGATGEQPASDAGQAEQERRYLVEERLLFANNAANATEATHV